LERRLSFVSKPSVDFRESIKFGAALFVAALTVASILFTAENIRAGTQERRAASAAAFISRFNDPEFFGQLLIWRRVFRAIQKMKPERIAEYIEQAEYPESASSAEEQDDRRLIAIQIFNFFEEMAGAIYEEQADERVLLHYFDTILLPYYSATEPWIKLQQQGDSSRVYIRVEQLVRRWRSETVDS
jgi:Domain of unknown function (DUF4760)